MWCVRCQCQWPQPVAGKYEWRDTDLLPAAARRHHHVEQVQVHSLAVDAGEPLEGRPVGAYSALVLDSTRKEHQHISQDSSKATI